MTARARAGDDEAFRQLIGPYQGELELHCCLKTLRSARRRPRTDGLP